MSLKNCIMNQLVELSRQIFLCKVGGAGADEPPERGLEESGETKT
jgi:hypothetical protein